MNRLVVTILFLGLLGVCWNNTVSAESWEEFVRLKKRSETPRLIPKGGVKPRLLRKDIVIREIRETGQLNTGPVSTGARERQNLTSDALLFEYGLPLLRAIPQNDQNIKTIAAAIKELGKEYPHYFVDGHTCDIGTDQNNCRLSWARAKTIYDRLVQEGIEPQALTMRGFGENPSTTAVPNTSEDNRKLNRRVVLIAYGTGPGSRWPNKDLAVVEAKPSTSGSGGPVDDKERYKCIEVAESSSGASSGERISESGYTVDADLEQEAEEPGDWEKSDRLQIAAQENLRQADMAAARGDSKTAEALRAAAEELEQASITALGSTGIKGMRAAGRHGIPRGFKALHRKTPIPKGGSESLPSDKKRIPAGFKPAQ